MELIDEYLQIAMEAWKMMQKTTGDKGEEWAERFERFFMSLLTN